MLQGRKIVLCVTGSVAAYKACELVRLLKGQGAEVAVAMTRAAGSFVTAMTFEALGAKVHSDETWKAEPLSHVALTDKADALVVAPATADVIAKAACGIADDFVSTLLLAAACPVVFAPAMNARMYANAATRRNILQLTEDGKRFIGPAKGELACGARGAGRMLEPEAIRREIELLFAPKLLEKCRVLVTAGPTVEMIDPVRAITNLSSGRQGYAVAEAFAQAGAEVTLVSGPTRLPCPAGLRRIDVLSAADMLEAVEREIADNEVFVSVAAVADWTVANRSDRKIKKVFAGAPAIELKPTVDILARVASRENPPFCVGFAAETENIVENARAKLFTKRASVIVANDARQSIGSETTTVSFVTAEGVTTLESVTKEAAARELVALVARMLN